MDPSDIPHAKYASPARAFSQITINSVVKRRTCRLLLEDSTDFHVPHASSVIHSSAILRTLIQYRLFCPSNLRIAEDQPHGEQL